jgi:hypothetical protein
MTEKEFLDRFDDCCQLAAETVCLVDGHREFVTIFLSHACAGTFPPIHHAHLKVGRNYFVVWRFHVPARVVEEDIQIDEAGLLDLQKVVCQDANTVLAILADWSFDPSLLVSPRECPVPI